GRSGGDAVTTPAPVRQWRGMGVISTQHFRGCCGPGQGEMPGGSKPHRRQGGGTANGRGGWALGAEGKGGGPGGGGAGGHGGGAWRGGRGGACQPVRGRRPSSCCRCPGWSHPAGWAF